MKMTACTAGLRRNEFSTTRTQLCWPRTETFSGSGILANSSCQVDWAQRGETKNNSMAASRETKDVFTVSKRKLHQAFLDLFRPTRGEAADPVNLFQSLQGQRHRAAGRSGRGSGGPNGVHTFQFCPKFLASQIDFLAQLV